MTTIAGAHAVITGGSSGIGLATAHELARRGAQVSLVARDPVRLTQAADELRTGGAAPCVASADVSDRVELGAAVDRLVGEQGPCDILVTSAGVSGPGYFDSFDEQAFRHQMEVNYFGTLHAVRAVVPSMIARREGSIVGISSTAGLLGVFGYAAYSASKFAVRGLFEALRSELKPHDVHVGCAFPPEVDTPMLAADEPLKPDETRAIVGSIKPLTAAQVATAIARGIERERSWIVCDVQTRLLAAVAGVAHGAVEAAVDGKARRASKAQR